jgi:Putative protein-S-isoprenylcysteine methyltransferase
MAGFAGKSGDYEDRAGKKRIRSIITGILNVAVMGVLLFVPAGTTDWPAAWVLLVFSLISFFINSLVVSPELLDERSRRHDNAKPWDRYLVAAIVISGWASMVVAGLDFRYGWTGISPITLQAAAFALVVFSGGILIWAMASNPFFSAVVRVQDERGQTVITGGPYRYVRHPGYAGWILYMLFLPLMLGSFIAVVPGVIAAVLDIVRTYLEDRILLSELAGYREYAGRVRYRLVPGVW